MRVFELAYCCRLFAESAGADTSSERFAEATGGRVDLQDPVHRGLLLQWLREWGCRSLRREDDARTSEALGDWWETWRGALPPARTTLDALDDRALGAASEAYGDLAQRAGPRRQLQGRLLDVRFGATTAAKAMFALRPHAFVPWDDAIRRALGFGSDADSYRRALHRARTELDEAAHDAGVATEDLPRLIGRPHSTPPKLIDEHDWVRYTARHAPPAREEVKRWLDWLSDGQGC